MKNFQTMKQTYFFIFLLAITFSISQSSGQITYVNLNPDVVLHEYDTYSLPDFPQFTFNFDHENFYMETEGGYAGYVTQNIDYAPYVKPYVSGQLIDGSVSYTSSSLYLIFYSVWLNDTVIGLTQPGVVTFLAFRNYLRKYGWIRCMLSADKTTFTIYDYAFDNTMDGSIIAGQQFNTGIEDEVSKSINVEVADNQIYISAQNKTADWTVHLYNDVGQQIFNHSMIDNSEIINCNQYQPGVYILRLQTEYGIINRKILLTL